MNNTINTPSITNAFGNRSVWHTDQLSKLSHAHFNSIVLNYAIGAFVSLLLFLSRPSTVVLGVSSIVVDPVDTMQYGIFMCSPDYGQKSKCLTCKVFDVWVKRGNDILVLAHAVDGLSSSEHPALNTLGARAFYGTKHQASIAI